MELCIRDGEGYLSLLQHRCGNEMFDKQGEFLVFSVSDSQILIVNSEVLK
jgi:hypothetical protein